MPIRAGPARCQSGPDQRGVPTVNAQQRHRPRRVTTHRCQAGALQVGVGERHDPTHDREEKLPQTDPDAALAFYRDTLGFEVRNDVGYGGMRWITVGPADQPGTSIVLYPPEADPGVTDDERRTIAEM